MTVNTSVWSDYLQPDASAAGDRLKQLICAGAPIAVPDTVMTELLSGPTDEATANDRGRMLEAFDVLPSAPLIDALLAASLQRACRCSSWSALPGPGSAPPREMGHGARFQGFLRSYRDISAARDRPAPARAPTARPGGAAPNPGEASGIVTR